MSEPESYDLIAIGGGSGGLAAAQRAAEYGARAVVIESARLGGTCVNVGCVPKKIMWNAAHIMEAAQDAKGYAITLGEATCDWAELVSRRDAYVERLNGIYAANLDRRNVTLVRGTASFVDAHTIAVGDRCLTAPHIIIATGGRPIRPDIPGAELALTSDDFFALKVRPARVAVVGSGYIAVELSGVLHGLGSQVTHVIRRDVILREFDPMIQTGLARAMDEAGVKRVTGFLPARLERKQDGLMLAGDDGRTLGGFDALIWAIGRGPNTQSLALERAGVTCDRDGYVMTDAMQNTSVEGVYAIGDVTGRAALTPVAIAAGRRLSDRVFGGQADRHLDYDLIPTVVFSHPPVASAGLTEPAARARYSQVEIRSASFVPMYYALGAHKVRCEMKLVLAGERRQVVGCHILGIGADEMLQGFAVAMRMGATLDDFNDTIAIHPTVSEELVTMR